MSCACDECDDLSLATGPTGATGPAGPSGITTLLLGAENIFVSKDGTTAALGATSRDLTKSFSTHTEAIVKASALAPSASNIVNIITYPGAYTENFTIPQYVNLITVTPNELIFNPEGYSTVATKSANALRPVYVNGTITVASDNVNIVGVNCNTLAVNTTGTNCSFNHMVVSAAITTNNTTPSSKFYDVHSPIFLSLPSTGTLSGYYEKCTGGSTSFAGNSSANAGNISGTLVDCVATTYSFASANANNGGTISGKLVRCIGIESPCFASSSSGTAGTISGTLEDCTDTSGISFASSSTGAGGTLEGTFIRCRTEGDKSFGYGVTGGTLSGRFIDCIGFGNSFGCFTTTGGTLSGNFINCKDIVASVFSFGSTASGDSAVLSGNFENCTAFGLAFGVASTGTAGSLSGKFNNCVVYTTDYCFASSVGGEAGGISGILTNCRGGGHAFCSSDTTGGSISGEIINCFSDGDNMFRMATVSGKIVGARANNTVAGDPAIIVDASAILRYCDLKPGAGGTSVTAAAPVSIAMVHCNLYGGGTNNVTNLVTTAYCTDDANDLF